MGELLVFHRNKTTRRRKLPDGGAEIILFPGVRYMRMEEPVRPAKRPPRRTPRRRERPKERAS